MDPIYSDFSADAIDAPRAGNIAAAVAAGFPGSLLLPICPPIASGMAETALGKAPAVIRGDGSWEGLRKWQNGTSAVTREACDAAGANCGLILGLQNHSQQFLAIDGDMLADTPADVKAGAKVSVVIVKTIAAVLGRPVWVRTTRPGRCAVLVRLPPEQQPGGKTVTHLNHAERGPVGKIELLTRGQQIVIAGKHPFTKREAYWWRTDAPGTKCRAPLVDDAIVTLKSRAAVDALLERIEEALAKIGVTCTSKKTPDPRAEGTGSQLHSSDPAPSGTMLAGLLKRMTNPVSTSRETYAAVMLAVAGCVRAAKAAKPPLITAEEERSVITEAAAWAARWESNTSASQAVEEAKLRSDWLKRDQLFSGWRNLLNQAVNLGVDVSPEVEATAADEFEAFDVAPDPDACEPTSTPLPLSAAELTALDLGRKVQELVELDVVKVFADAFQDLFKYDQSTRAWLIYDDAIGWRLDTARRVEHVARQFVRLVRGREPTNWDPKDMRAAGKIGFSTAVRRASESEPQMSTKLEDWNSEEHVLGIPGGYVDLRSGAVAPPRGADMIRFRTSVAPAAAGTPCPIWSKFLGEMTCGDPQLQAWLQRYAGYLLTGSVKEERVAFLFGDGGNGKGVFIKAIAGILGDYTYQCPAEFFKEDSRLNRQPHIAQMAGKRLVVSSELEQGARLAETLLKDLSGNDNKVKGTALYSAAIEFEFQAKILLVGNHPPRLHGVNEAMRRRLDVLPAKAKPAERDPDLKSKLVAEHGAILRWMVDGAVQWYREGLGTCAAITAASADYFDGQDVISQWLEDCATCGHGLEASVQDALGNHNAWLRARYEAPVTTKAFEVQLLRNPTIIRLPRTKHGIFYGGFSLQSSPVTAAADEFDADLARPPIPAAPTSHLSH